MNGINPGGTLTGRVQEGLERRVAHDRHRRPTSCSRVRRRSCRCSVWQRRRKSRTSRCSSRPTTRATSRARSSRWTAARPRCHLARWRYRDLRDFIAQLEARGELKRVHVPVDPRLEMTELCDRVLKAGGPALLFERPRATSAPGHDAGARQSVRHAAARRAAMGVDGDDWRSALRDIGRLLAFLKEPEPPKSLDRCLADHAARVHEGARHGAEGALAPAPCQEVVWEGATSTCALAGADVLAGRRRAADHVGPDRHARAAQEAAEPRHLPPAGDWRATRSSCAGSRIAAARSTSAITRSRNPGHAVSGRGRARRRSGDDPRRRDAGAGHAVRVPVRRAAARRRAPSS